MRKLKEEEKEDSFFIFPFSRDTFNGGGKGKNEGDRNKNVVLSDRIMI